jgi:NADH-quinone oxidoreductase subunit G
VIPASYPAKDGWHWISDLLKASGKHDNPSWENFDDVVTSLTEMIPLFSGIKQHLPNADFRFYNEKIARQTLRFSGRTAINAGILVSEPKPPEDDNTPMTYSMEGYKGPRLT